MSDEIRPALTSEEWRDVQAGTPLTFLSDNGLQVVDAGDGTKFYVRVDANAKTFTNDDGSRWVVAEIDRWDTEGLAQLAAMLLSHLPGGHPLKITREDASLVRSAGDAATDHMREHYGYPEHETPAAMVQERDVILRLAAKLVALLPPN